MYSGLLGKSIKYSMSPFIHNEFYKTSNIPLQYKIFDIEERDIEVFLKKLKENNIIGFNVTIPYKEYIIRFLQELKYPAREIGAVNTVLVTEEGLVGYNTDYHGFIKSLKDINFTWKSSKALVIGGGGAGKAVIYALKSIGASKIDVVIRNNEALIEQKKLIDDVYNFNMEFVLDSYDIVVNCTPLGGANHREKPPIKIISAKKSTLFYDLNYEPETSIFLKRGIDFHCSIINGKEMLFNQAYKAIEIWTEKIIEDL